MRNTGSGEESSYTSGYSTGAGGVGMLLVGVGIGAALMYILDPERGRSRRARLSDQAMSKINRLGDAAASQARDLRNRAQGLVHEAGSLLPGRAGQREDQANGGRARAQAAGQNT